MKKTSGHDTSTGAFCNGNKGIGDRGKGIGKCKDQSATSATTRAKCKVKSAAGATSRANQVSGDEALMASLETQMAALESQIALLKEGMGKREEKEPLSPWEKSPLENSPLEKSPRTKLETPVIHTLTAIGSRFLRVSWTPVAGAIGYEVRWATNPALTSNYGSLTVASPAASAIVSGLGMNTNYYVGVKALADNEVNNSDVSETRSARTSDVPAADTVTFLQSWFTGLQTTTQDFATLLPQIETTELNTSDRMRLLGSGVRRYGFIEKTADVAGDFPQIWPGLVEDTGKLKELVGEIEVLRNLLVWSRWVTRVVQGLLLIAGDDAFRLAGAYYAAARDGARRKNPEAVQVFDMLRLFWKRPRRITEEPTLPEIERDVRALMRGTKDGKMIIENESPHMTGGVREFVDNVQRKPRGGVKVVEQS